MNNFFEFQKITRLFPGGSGHIDWEGLLKSSLSPIFENMSRTYQNPKYHGEIDVLSHTKMVCEEIIKQPEYVKGNDTDKIILFWSALLHDIGKIICTAEIDGELKSPHHSAKGAIMARGLLWRELGLCGSYEKQQIREAICNLIRYHSFPPYALNSTDPELRLLSIAANSELVKYFSIEKLCALERADALGRIYSDGDDMTDRVTYCKMLAKELGCFDKPYIFANSFSERAYFKGKTTWKEQNMFDDSWGTVILLSGLPGTGKDTYINERYPNLPMISLDEIRKELDISPTDNQGKVVAAGHERAKEYLRKHQPFIWNATNITTQTRNMQISLFEDYGANVKTIFLETEWETQLIRNKKRLETVPESVIENMLSKLVLPERYESASVIWEIV